MTFKIEISKTVCLTVLEKLYYQIKKIKEVLIIYREKYYNLNQQSEFLNSL